MGKIILGIETATKICSVAISDGEKLLALKEEGGEYSHAEKLNGFIDECLKQANVTLQQIDAVAVSKGPGSYTGLRIGVSTAKGLCYALKKPLISVDTLQAMALSMSKTDDSFDLYVPMIDARRMEVYTGIFNVGNDKEENISAKIIDENSFAVLKENNRLILFGDGAEKCRETLVHSNIVYSHKGLPSAAYINKIAQQKLVKNEIEDVAYFEPYYLKDFVATTAKKLL